MPSTLLYLDSKYHYPSKIIISSWYEGLCPSGYLYLYITIWSQINIAQHHQAMHQVLPMAYKTLGAIMQSIYQHIVSLSEPTVF